MYVAKAKNSDLALPCTNYIEIWLLLICYGGWWRNRALLVAQSSRIPQPRTQSCISVEAAAPGKEQKPRLGLLGSLFQAKKAGGTGRRCDEHRSLVLVSYSDLKERWSKMCQHFRAGLRSFLYLPIHTPHITAYGWLEQTNHCLVASPLHQTKT